MKNTTILLLLFCCAFPAFMQGQTEFSQTGTIWKTNYLCYGTLNDKYVYMDYVYKLGGDTLIGDKSCKKLYLDDSLIGAFLEENKEVWYYPFSKQSDVQERLLMYDFSKNKGDKIESYRIVWNACGNLSNISYIEEQVTLTVDNVYYEYGRKVMEVSAQSTYGKTRDVWIEGIGSPLGFWCAYLMTPTDGSQTDTNIVQVIASDKTLLYYNGQIIDLNYQSTFLKKGKTWEIQNLSKGVFKISLGDPQMINNYPSYPVYSDGYFQRGYLYDVNGTIYWYFECDNIYLSYYLYNFNYTVGDKIYLCTELERTAVYYAPRKYTPYDVTQVDMIQCMGKTLKRIVLEGEIKHVWLEDVGSLNLLLYLDGNGYHYNAPEYKLLRCYVGDEMIYDSSDFPDGIEETLLSTPTYSVIDNQLIVKNGYGYSLSLYDLSGVEVSNQILSESEETIPLPAYPATMLIGRLQKGDITISFKIGDTGK